MSWQTFVDKHLMVELSWGHRLSSAAITGLDGHIWARSQSFPQITNFEIEKIIRGFDDAKEMGQHGIHVGGVKYIFIRSEPGHVLRGKKGLGGITIKKTNKALVFGIYEEPVAPNEGSIVVERLGDYLLDEGF